MNCTKQKKLKKKKINNCLCYAILAVKGLNVYIDKLSGLLVLS